MKTFLYLCLLFCSMLGFAQPKYFEKNISWKMIHNGDAIFQSGDNYTIFGESANADLTDWNTYKMIINNDGDTVQINQFETPSEFNSSFFTAILTEYGYAFCGGMSDPLNASLTSYLLRVDYEGQLIDTMLVVGGTINQSFSYTIARTPDNGYLLGGYRRIIDNNGNFSYPYLLRLDANFNTVWDTTYQLTNFFGYYSGFTKIIPNYADSTYYLVGNINNFEDVNDVLWLHINEQGHILHQRVITEPEYFSEEVVSDFIKTTDGDFVLGITKYNNGPAKAGIILKLSPNGDTIRWAKKVFDLGVVSKIYQLPDSSYLVAGEASPSATNPPFNAAIAHVSANGDSIYWQRSYGGAGDDDYIYDFTPTSDGGYFFVGRTETNVPNGHANVYLLKTNCMGLLTEPIANYSYTNPNGNTIVFQNLSQYTYLDSIDGGHYLWDFGDGFNSNEQNPTHTYAQAGIYLAKLTAIVCQDTSLMYQSICIGTSAHPAPSFTHTLQNDTLVSFTNTSSNAQNAVFIWDFGDGSPPTQTITQQALQHSYTQAGEHQVTLSVIMCLDTTVYTQVVNTYAVGMQVLPLEGGVRGGLCTVLPNPANEQISISPPSGGWGVQTHTFVLYDVLGKAVLQKALSPTTTQIPTEHLPSGIYLYQIIDPQNQTLQHGKLSILH